MTNEKNNKTSRVLIINESTNAMYILQIENIYTAVQKSPDTCI